MTTHHLLSSLFWLGFAGYYLLVLGLFGFLRPIWLLPVFVPILLYISRYIRLIIVYHSPLSHLERLLIVFLGLQLLVYSAGLFIPETGFDALWYHLPEAQVYAATGRIAPIPELLYSTMPRLGEMYYAAAYFTHSLIGVKLVAFLIGIIFLGLSYHLGRQFLSRPQSLLATIVIASMPLFAWQTTSGYVDLISATFLLGALLCLMSGLKSKSTLPLNHLILAGIFSGFALSVKIQAGLGLLGGAAFILALPRHHLKSLLLYSATAILVCLPWYLNNYLQSGHPLYPANLPSLELSTLQYAGASSLPRWLESQTLRLPSLFYDFTFYPKDYLTPIFLILLPILIWQLKKMVRVVLPLFLYTLAALVIWFYTPPLETRFLLFALPPLLILELRAVFSLPDKYSTIKNWTVVFAFLTIGLNLACRLGAEAKYLPVLLHRQTPEQYVASQTTDFNRSIITKFYSGYWLSYHY